MIDTYIYIVETESGEYEDVRKHIKYAGTDKDEAFREAGTLKSPDTHTVYFSIWKDGKEIGEITRSTNSDKWERKSGDVTAFRIFGIYFNPKGELLNPAFVKIMTDIRGEINKVYRPDLNSIAGEFTASKAANTLCVNTIIRIHHLLAKEGF